MRSIIFLGLFILCGGNAEATRSSRKIQYTMGGAHITFTGIQIEEKSELKCLVRFPDGRDSIEVKPSVSRDGLSAICRLPPEISQGSIDIDLEITTDNGVSTSSEKLAETIFIDPNPLFELDVVENWDANELSFTWNPTTFEQFFNPGVTIMVQLTLHVSNGADPPVFTDSGIIRILGLNAPGITNFAIVDAVRNRISDISSPYFYAISAVGTQAEIYMSSGLFAPTLGVNDIRAMEMCLAWLQNARPPPPAQIHPCPPCLCQVGLDTSFMETEFDPQIVRLSNGALDDHVLYHERVSTEGGHAQTCSYNTLTTFLATTSPQAGWIHGVSKYNSYVDNYFADVWPYITCCLQSNRALLCDRFHENRPTDTGHEYPGAESPCSGFGDPHMVTFESVKYDFMGYGEFWLIRGPKDSRFGVQGRMAPNTPEQRVSFFKAVAMRDGNTTVQVEPSVNNLQILLNGIEFRTPTFPFVLHMDRVSLIINANTVDVRFRAGFTIIVQNHQSFLNIFGSGAHYNRGKGFMGIFGKFDDDINNDLTAQNGFEIPPTQANLMDLALIHHLFGLTWMTTANESYFVYKDGTSWATHENAGFGPIYQYPDPATLPEEVRAICGDSLFCYYEYVGTGSLEKAADVARVERELDELREEKERMVPMCETIRHPENGRVRVGGHLNGASATYSCNEEYDFLSGSGDRVRTCSASEESSSWSGAEPVCIWTCTTCLPSMDFHLSHDPNDCSKFFLCSYGERFSLDCPIANSFDPELGGCSPDHECDSPPGCTL